MQQGVTDGHGPCEDGGGGAGLEVDLFFEAALVGVGASHDAVAVSDSLGAHLINGLQVEFRAEGNYRRLRNSTND